MALTTAQQALLLFKKWLGLGQTTSSREFFNETLYPGRVAVYTNQIWTQASEIPNTAPVLTNGQTSGVVQYWQNSPLITAPGTTNAFTSSLLRDAIPFNYGDGTSYNYTVRDSVGTTIPFGQGDWIIDTDAGLLTFYSTVPANMPPNVSFYKYVGAKGFTSSSVAITASLFGTASFATSASFAPIILPSGIVSSSTQINTGSFTGSFIGIHSGSTFGTASWAISASYILPSGLPNGVISSSTQLPSGIVSSSTQINTGSFTGSFIGTHTGSLFGTASWAISSSYVLPSGLPSGIISSSTQLPSGTVSSSAQINTGSFTGSFIGTHTGSLFGTASWARNAISSSFATTASAATSITFTPPTASYALTASYAPISFIDNFVTVGLVGSDTNYTSIKSAVNSITDASANNTYTVRVYPGVYIEDTITLKPYIAVKGDSSISTIVSASNPANTIFIMADQSMVIDMQIQGTTATTSSAIIYSSPTTPQTNAIAYVENVRFGTNYTNAKVIGSGSGGNCILQCSNVKYGGFTSGSKSFDVGFYVTSGSDGGIGRMQLRNVTSTNGGVAGTDNDQIFALADAPGCTFIVNGCLLTRSTGVARGTGFKVYNGGQLRLTGVNFQRWITGIWAPQTGSAPSIDAIALNFENCTTDVQIDHSGSLGKVSGTDTFLKTIINKDAPLYEVNQDPRRITVAKKGGDFTSISASVAYITDSAENNRYVIEVGPGEFTEKQIDLRGKPYIAINGSDIQTTVIIPSGSGTFDQLIVGPTNEVSFVTFQGNNIAGYSALSIPDVGIVTNTDFAMAHKISIYDYDYGIKVCADTANSTFYGEYIDINGAFSYGVYVSSSNNFNALTNVENYYLFPSSSTGIGNYVVGPSSSLSLYTGLFVGDGTAGSTAIKIEQGAGFEAAALDMQNWDYGVRVPVASPAPEFRIVGSMIHNSNTYDFDVLNATTKGRFQGVASHAKINNVSDNFYWNFLDDEDGENDITRALAVTFADGTHTDATTLIFKGSPMGVMQGGTITTGSGFNITVASGFGYLQDSVNPDVYKRIDWVNGNLTLTANSNNYIYLTSAEVLTAAGSIPNNETNIILGRVVTNNTTIELIDQVPYNGEHMSNKLSTFNREALGPVYAAGSTVTEDSTPFTLDVTAGTYFFSENKFTPSGTSSINLTQYYPSASTWARYTSSIVPNNQYASSSMLVAMSSSAYTKHTLYGVGEGVDEKYFLVINSNQYSSLVSAENADLPSIPTYFNDGVVPLAAVYVQSGSATITQIQDIRPIIGFRAAGVNASSVHGNLLGLSADDHPQYLLVNGARAMAGTLSLGGNNITNVGTMFGTASWATNAVSAITASAADSITFTPPTASYSISSSFSTRTISASFAPDTTFPYTGSAIISGSTNITGSLSILSGSVRVTGHTGSQWNAIFHEAGITPVNSSVISAGQNKGITVQGSDGAFYMGRSINTAIEYLMGISSNGYAFAGSVTAHDFRLRTSNTDRITIQASTGNVGINTTAPGTTLHVQGNVSASSYTSSISNAVGFLGTASNATSASYALSASFAPMILPSGTVSSSIQINTGSFTGSFRGIFAGDGSQLTGVVASGVGINIADDGTVQGNAGQLNFGNFITATVALSTASINVTLPSGTVSSSQQINTGSFTGSFTGAFIGTSSWASNVISSSFATTSSYAVSASFAPDTTFPYTGSAIISGSTNITGSLYVMSGSINIRSGSSTLNVTIIPGVSARYAVDSAYHLFRVAGTDALSIDSTGFGPSANNTYLMGGTTNKFRTGYINNIISSGSITNTGSISIRDVLSGNITTLDGNTVTIGLAAIAASYINFSGPGVLFQYGASGTNYNNSTGNGISSSPTWTFDNYSSGRRTHFRMGPTFNGQTIATGSGTAGLDGLLINPQFGTATKLQWDSSNNIIGLAVEPVFDVNLTSTGKLTALNIMPSSSLALTSSMSLINAGVNGTSSFVVSASGDVTIQRQLTVFGGITSSLFGTSSWASNVVSSSFATTASYALNATATLPNGIISSSTQFTSLTAPFTGSFTGSFKGDGAGLTGVTATAFPYVGAAVISGSLTVTGSGIDVISGSVSASALKIGNNTTFTDAFGSSTISAGASFLRFRVGGVGFFYNGIGLSPENTLQRDLGAADYQWLNLYTKNIFTSGSIINTGSLNIISGSVTSSGPTGKNGFYAYNGAATITAYMRAVDGVGVEIGSLDQSVFLRAANQSIVQVSTLGFFPPADLGTDLGITGNRWRSLVVGNITASIISASSTITTVTLYSNNIFSTGSITHTGSFNITSGSINITNGGVTSSLFGTASWATSASWAPGGSATFPYTGIAVISGSLIVTGSSGVTVTGPVTIAGALQATTKSFKIDHQLLSGKKLIYGVLEGPEHGVYVRGRLTKNTVIQLPEEWEWLVDPDSITVQLTPIGTQQVLYVQNIENNTVIINSNTPIDCFYYIQATRKDVAPLTTVE